MFLSKELEWIEIKTRICLWLKANAQLIKVSKIRIQDVETLFLVLSECSCSDFWAKDILIQSQSFCDSIPGQS